MKILVGLLLLFAAAPPYIDGGGAQITLPEIILEFHRATLLEVVRAEPARGAFRFKTVKPLKGALAAKDVRLQIAVEGGEANPFRDLKPGQQAVFFTECYDKRSLTCIDGVWSWTQPAQDGWENGAVRRDFEHVFVGTSTELAEAVVKLLRGHDVTARCRRRGAPADAQWVRYSMKFPHDKSIVRDPAAPPARARRTSDWIAELQDPKALVRVQAGLALAELGPAARESENALVKALQDSDPDVRYAAVIALGATGADGKDAIDGLARVLQDESWFVRFPATQVLAKLGPKAAGARAALVEAMAPKDGVKDFRPIRCAQAAAALAKIDPGAKEIQAALPLILQRLLGYDGDGSDGARVVGAEMLGECGKAALPAVPALIQRLKDPDADVRVAVAVALIKIIPEKQTEPALETLGAELKNPDLLIRVLAADALGSLGPRARPQSGALSALLQDPEIEVRQAAREALRRISGN